MERKYSLLQLNMLLRRNIERNMPDEYWVEAEVAELRESGGHCYMELVQKDEHTNTPVAKASARCWRSTWLFVKDRFIQGAGQPLAKGMKALLRVYAQFHENFGFSWIVTDIDPTFSLGDMAAKRREIIRQLKEEGVFDDNHNLTLPIFAQRIAVVSSATAAGYGDFCNQLADNAYGYVFQTRLFPSVMQGEGVEQGIIAALDSIYGEIDDFDCVVIARGGGATSDLSGFDTLDLARCVANFPLPIITGIGHDRDESVLDMIAFQRVKTPTAAADYLVEHLRQADLRIEEARLRITRYTTARMNQERLRLNHIAVRIPTLFSLVSTRQTARLDALMQRVAHRAQRRVADDLARLAQWQQRMPTAAERRLTHEQHRTQLLQQRIESLDPQRLLARGYSITTLDGHALHDAAQTTPGAKLVTHLHHGTVVSVVENK